MADIVNISREKDTTSALDFWLKRQAIQVVAQLPEDRNEALRVLAYAQELVVSFLARD